MKYALIALATLLAGCGGGSTMTTAPAPAPVLATPGPVVFIGDSITAKWHTELVVAGSVNRGVSTQLSCAMLERFDADVLALKPSKVLILAGINDLAFDPAPSTQCVTDMAQRALAAGAEVFVGTLLPHENWGPDKLIQGNEAGRAAIAHFNADLRTGAAAFGFKLIEYNAAMIDGAGAQIPGYFIDKVHPSEAGYAVMAALVKAALLLH